MKQQIVRLDEAALARLGFDRVLIAALRNVLRVTGNESDGITVPELGQKADETKEIVAALREQIIMIQFLIDAIQLSPLPETPDLGRIDDLEFSPPFSLAQQVEHLTTEVRHIADQLAEMSEHLTTEVRQIADQQIVNANLIHEIRQGTML